jgi:hypothetical protein
MVTTSHSYAVSYAALHSRLKGIAVEEQKSKNSFCGYNAFDVTSRLMQRYAELGVFEFTRLSAEIYRNTGKLPVEDETMNCGGLLFHSNINVSLSVRMFISQLMRFFALWGTTLFVIIFSLKVIGQRRRLTLLYGVGRQDLLAEGSDARFLDFCRNGKLPPVEMPRHLVIQAYPAIISTDQKQVTYGRVPLLQALRLSGLGLRCWLYALGLHIFSLFSFILSVCLKPNLILLGVDAAMHAVATVLNRESVLEDVTLTTSNYFAQPLWMWALPNRNFELHMVWYSQNMYPISYVDEVAAVPIPNLSFLRADVHWVWSKGFLSFLQGICPPAKYKIVPPVVWHLKSACVPKVNRPRRIALFDVTPVNATVERKMGLIRNYYTPENMSCFIRDVVDAAQEVVRQTGSKIEVMLKHKRTPELKFHSPQYAATISNFEKNGLIQLIPADSNIHDVLSDCDILVAAPYSSPAYLGLNAGKIAFWYDPTETLDWKNGTPEIMLVKGKKQLLTEIIGAFV